MAPRAVDSACPLTRPGRGAERGREARRDETELAWRRQTAGAGELSLLLPSRPLSSVGDTFTSATSVPRPLIRGCRRC